MERFVKAKILINVRKLYKKVCIGEQYDGWKKER